MFEKTYIHDTEIYRVVCVSIFKPFYLRWNDISTILHTLKRNGYVTVLNYNFSRLIRFLSYGNSRSEGDCNSPRHPSFYETSSNYVLRTNKARNKITLWITRRVRIPIHPWLPNLWLGSSRNEQQLGEKDFLVMRTQPCSWCSFEKAESDTVWSHPSTKTSVPTLLIGFLLYTTSALNVRWNSNNQRYN